MNEGTIEIDKWKHMSPEEIEKMGGQKLENGKSPLLIQSKCIYTPDELIEQIKENLKRKLVEFQQAIVPNNGDFCMVGSGPSLEYHLNAIKDCQDQGMPIISIKGAHDWLIERGIIPDICIMLDPQPKILNCIKYRGQWPNSHKGCIYMIASQCDPKIFSALSRQRVVLWHALSNMGEAKILKGRMLVGGGTTTGLRAVNIGYLMGFRRFRMFGFDSCLKDKESKIKRISGEKATKVLDVECGKKVFYCNPAMAAQANELQSMITMFDGNIRLKSYGYGLITELLRERRRAKVYDWFDPDLEAEFEDNLITSTNDLYPEEA
tara:strand:- start:1600 stop:2562 length:963 start_codon:yes stop_codon:yes gene_type:complete